MENQEILKDRNVSKKATVTLAPYINIWIDDEPVCVKIIPSGWSEPRMYHLLIEHGDYEKTDYHFVNSDQLKSDFGIDLDEKAFHSYIITPEEVNETPNDFELGDKIRRKLIKTNDKSGK